MIEQKILTASVRDRYGVLLISLATLMYEILLTRIFSVTMYYHFAFMAISVALFGMSLGALIVHFYPKIFTLDKTKYHLAENSLFFSIAILASYIFHIAFPIIFDGGVQQFLTLGVTYAIFLIPFSFSGICISLALTRFPNQIGKIYAYDLVGASLGALTIIFIITLGGPAAIIFASLLVAFAAFLFGRGIYAAKVIFGVIAGIAILLIGTVFLERYNIRPLSPEFAKGYITPEYIYDKWNSFSRVTVDDRGLSEPVGWGFAPNYRNDKKIRQLYLRIDADAGTPITRFKGDLGPVDFLKYDIINLVHYIRPDSSELVIGAGGGRDVLSALVFGQRSVTAVEINENILKAVNQQFGDFSGHLDKYPQIKFVNDEARSWLARSKEVYDIIQISLIDTWAATTAGAFTLSENSLYTVEGWQIFLEHLSEKGVLTVSRWYAKNLPGEIYRLTSLAKQSLEAAGIVNARDHVLIFRSVPPDGGRAGNPDGVGTMLVSKTPFSSQDIATLNAVARKMGFEVVLSPEHAIDRNFETLISDANAADALRDQLKINVAAPTDDKPFFFHMMRISDALLGKAAQQGYNTFNLRAVRALAYLFLIIAALTILILIVPLSRFSGIQARAENFWLIVFFIAIGLGFMLIEISQMQKFIILLGHPTYSLSITLFALLLGGGVGSYFAHWVNRSGKRSHSIAVLCMLVVVLLLVGWATPWLIHAYTAATVPVRIFISLAAFLPLGLFMGTAFPMGMHIAKSAARSKYDITPWLWGLNGAASVLSSVIAVIVSISWGISAAYWAGVAAYIAALISASMLVMTAKSVE